MASAQTLKTSLILQTSEWKKKEFNKNLLSICYVRIKKNIFHRQVDNMNYIAQPELPHSVFGKGGWYGLCDYRLNIYPLGRYPPPLTHVLSPDGGSWHAALPTHDVYPFRLDYLQLSKFHVYVRMHIPTPCFTPKLPPSKWIHSNPVQPDLSPDTEHHGEMRRV